METTLRYALPILKSFHYIKLTIDGKVYYDDTSVWESYIDITDEIDGSRAVKSIDIEIVHEHHSIITIITKESENYNGL